MLETVSGIVHQSTDMQELDLIGNRRYSSGYPWTGDPLRGTTLHASTLAVFLLGMVAQGFSPCPHHASLDPSGHAEPAVSMGATPAGMPQADATPADSQSEHDEDFCSCLNVCDTGSGDSFSPGPSHTQPPSFTALNVEVRLDTSLLDTRQSAYLAPLPQPPPHNA